MKNKFIGIDVLIALIGFFLVGCAGNAQPASVAVAGGKTLDQAIAEAAVRIDERIEAGTKIALLNFNSPSDRFSLYVLDELSANLLDSGRLTVVDRREVDLIRNEFEFQFSGEVGDDSMQELGRMLGAQSIVSGSLTEIGGDYRIVIRVLNVQTASVAVQYRADIDSDRRVQSLLEGGRTGGIATASVPAPAPVQAQAPTPAPAPAPIQVTPTQTPPRPETPLRMGIWKLSGREGNTRWDADLVIQNFRNNEFTGYFDWYEGPSEIFGGREYFEGTYNDLRQLAFMRGTRLERRRNIATGQYQARVSSDGMRLTDGTWGGGTWTAVWVREE